MRLVDATLPFQALAAVVKTQHRLLGRQLLVEGAQQVPTRGPAIVACNHISYADPIVLGMAVERRGRAIRYLAKRELFGNPLLKPLLLGTQQIPVDRQGDGAASFADAERAIASGAVVGIFPEATIPRKDRPPPLPKTGAARLALGTGAPLVPAGTWGGQQISGKDTAWVRYGARMAVCFAPPLEPEPAESPGHLTTRLMREIAALTAQARTLVDDTAGSHSPG